jgi:hypothetical protein
VEPAAQVRALCQKTLTANWASGERDGVAYAYTRPSPDRYQWQWYWDSCFSAIVWRRFDVQHSRLELDSLLAAARDDGFIGHTIFWERPVSGARRLDGDGLLWLLQPDESGLDASPQFDPIWRHRAQGLPGVVELVHRNRELGFRIQAVREAGGPIVCEVMTNVLYGLSQLAMGRPSVTAALIDRLYDERNGLFMPEAWPAPVERIPLTWSALAPLALPDLPDAIGRRLVEEHLPRGMGAESFAWSTLALELLEPDPDAHNSHLGALAPSWSKA